jgi:hypothetical protein
MKELRVYSAKILRGWSETKRRNTEGVAVQQFFDRKHRVSSKCPFRQHHSAEAVIAMIYLCCGGLTIELPTSTLAG